jgi:O-methyltransferase
MTTTINNNQMYIDLLKKVLIDYPRIQYDEYKTLRSYTPNWRMNLLMRLDNLFRTRDFAICKRVAPKEADRIVGKDWPVYADTMIGLKRLDNIDYCLNTIIDDNIPGDVIETGVWRGGATILMKAILKARNVTDKTVWVADSFEGLPKPDAKKYAADSGDKHHTMNELAISKEIVEGNFRKYGLLDEKVKFLKGWFKDTLPTAPITQLALIRLDGDMYESTMDGITNLYPKLAKGGFLLVDDFGGLEGCRKAIMDYRKMHGIKEEIKQVDWTGVYWRKES